MSLYSLCYSRSWCIYHISMRTFVAFPFNDSEISNYIPNFHPWCSYSVCFLFPLVCLSRIFLFFSPKSQLLVSLIFLSPSFKLNDFCTDLHDFLPFGHFRFSPFLDLRVKAQIIHLRMFSI